jgi:replicative DNA helicase Mcm
MGEIIKKSITVLGMTATKAGLGSGMIKIDGRLVPRAGVLVMYSGGLVRLDELDKMDKEDKHSVLECMEQQTVTATKAGAPIHLTAKTVIVAAANPKYGMWDYELGLMENINLDPYLVSRFDIMWRLVEVTELEESNIAAKKVGLETIKKECLFDTCTFRKFINYVKHKNPILSKSAAIKLHSFYMKMRKPTGDKRTLPMEIRQLEGMIRYSGAIAKAKQHDEVLEEDVDECIQLYRDSLKSFSIDTNQDVQQFRMTDFKLDKEQELMELVHKQMDEDGEFVSTDVISSWAQSSHFKSIESARKKFEGLIGDKILLCGNGRYRLTTIQ